MRPRAPSLPESLALCAALCSASEARAQSRDVRLPMRCSRGSSSQQFAAQVAAPAEHPSRGIFRVRIDSRDSGLLSHFGLYAIYNMTTDYELSAGAHFVPGSARVLPGTGTPNVTGTARLGIEAGVLRLVLPARVPHGSRYTPPSIEFDVSVDAPAGAAVTLLFTHYHVDASVFLLGDIRTNCDPPGGPGAVATVRVLPPR